MRHELHEPAKSIIERLGGTMAVSQALGVSTTLPYRWRYPKEARGTGGVIPQRYHRTLLEHAKKKGVKLKAEDFLPAVTATEAA